MLLLAGCVPEPVEPSLPTAPMEADADTDADADADADADSDADTDLGPVDTGFARLCDEDPAEPNDTLAEALPLPSTRPLAVGQDAPDVWRITLPAGQLTTIEVLHEVVRGDLDIEVLDEAGTVLARGRTSDDDERVVLVNHGTRDARVFLRVTMWNPDPCNTYDVVVVPTPAMACPDDSHEPNDVQADAAPIEAVTQATAFPFGPDVYRVDLQPGDRFSATLQESAAGELDVRLFDRFGQLLDEDTVGSVYTVTLDTIDQLGSHYVEVRANGCVPYSVEAIVERPPVCTVDAREPDDDPTTAPVLASAADLSAGGTDVDVSRATLEAGQVLDVRLLTSGTYGTPSITLEDPAGTVLDTADAAPWRVRHTAAVAGDVRVRVSGDACFDYALDATVFSPPDCTLPDALDALSPNDTYPSATPLTASAGSVGLLAAPGDNDNLRWTVPDRHRLRVDVRPDTLAFGLPTLTLMDTDPTSIGASPLATDAVGPTWGLEHVNATGLDTDYTLRVEASACMDYALDWVIEDCAHDDLLEPNDTPQTARPATAAVDQIVHAFSDDHWALGTVAPGRTIRVDVAFTHADGDLDAYLLRADGASLLGVQGGTGSADGEFLTWTNPDGTPVDVVLRVTHDGTAPCRSNTYGFAVRP
jgi:hypothetical protein